MDPLPVIDSQGAPATDDGTDAPARAERATTTSPPARSRERGLSSLQLERILLGTFLAPEFRPVFGMVGITLAVGTIFYRIVEGWGLLDSLYFSVVTLATIGFGDEVPTTRLGKLFTIIYVFVGVGTLGVFLSAVARSATRQAMAESRKTDESDTG